MIPERINRILLWLNLVLLLIITSAIVTFLIMRSSSSGRQITNPVEMNSMEMLRTELELNDEQYAKVLVENDRTLRTYNLVLDMMCEANVAMIEELARPESDPVVLDSLARKVGTLNTSLRRHTSDYFVNLKAICNDAQQQKLTLIFKQMMQLENQCKTCNKINCPRRERIDNIGK